MADRIPALTPEQFVARLFGNFPAPWTGDDAKQPGGVAYAYFKMVGDQLTVLLDGIKYVESQLYTLLQTFPQLSLINQSAATRQALSKAIQKITGVAPRMIEPWAPCDTGAWDAGLSYWDVDTAQNPALYGDPSLRYQGFIISTFAPSDIGSVTGGQPVETWDDAGYWDIAGQALLPLPANKGVNDVLSQIVALHAFGTVIYVKFVASLP